MTGNCEEIDSSAFSKFGVFSVKITKPGVYYYKVQSEDNIIISAVVASPPPKVNKNIIQLNHYKFLN
jgi:hypothetical protein